MKKFLINKISKTMKKLHSILMMLAIMVAALGFTACSDDDDDKGKVEASIVGVWEITAYDVDPIEMVENGTIIPEDIGSTWKFTSKGKLYSGNPNNPSASWSIDKNNLYVTSDAFPVPFKYNILYLNETSLKLELKLSQPTFNQNGDIEYVEIITQITFKKIS